MDYNYREEVLDEFGQEDARLIDLAEGLYNAIMQWHRANREIASIRPLGEYDSREAWAHTREAWAASARVTLNEIRKAR